MGECELCRTGVTGLAGRAEVGWRSGIVDARGRVPVTATLVRLAASRVRWPTAARDEAIWTEEYVLYEYTTMYRRVANKPPGFQLAMTVAHTSNCVTQRTGGPDGNSVGQARGGERGRGKGEGEGG